MCVFLHRRSIQDRLEQGVLDFFCGGYPSATGGVCFARVYCRRTNMERLGRPINRGNDLVTTAGFLLVAIPHPALSPARSHHTHVPVCFPIFQFFGRTCHVVVRNKPLSKNASPRLKLCRLSVLFWRGVVVFPKRLTRGGVYSMLWWWEM